MSDATGATVHELRLLPSGVTVDLLGSAEHLSKDKPWWRPSV